MKKIVLFIEPCETEIITPFKCAYIFMNQCTIDEDAGFEIVRIAEFEKSSVEISDTDLKEAKNFKEQRKQKGMALIISLIGIQVNLYL